MQEDLDLVKSEDDVAGVLARYVGHDFVHVARTNFFRVSVVAEPRAHGARWRFLG